MIKKSSVPLIVGATIKSAGIGGVTIHIQRLKQWLKKNGFEYDSCDYKVLPMEIQLKQILHHKVAHIHISKPLLRLVFVIYCLLVGTKSILTVHGNIGRFAWLKNLMDQISVRLCTIPILINNNSYEIAKRWNKRSVQISAFIPPVEDGAVPKYVETQIESARCKGKTIVACNASVKSFTDAGEETYGVSFAVDFFKDKCNYFLCVSDPSGQYAEQYKEDKFNNILFITDQHSFYKLMTLSDIMLRPTATDGDSLSVKEGLWLRKKVIATDRVNRPNGVILFHYNDADSLTIALKSNTMGNTYLDDANVVPAIIGIYNDLIAK